MRSLVLSSRATYGALAAGLIGVALVVYFATLVFRDVYRGIPPAAPIAVSSAACESRSPDRLCATTVVRLNQGRFRIATSNPAESISIRVERGVLDAQPLVVLARTTAPGRLRVSRAGSEADTVVAQAVIPHAGVRVLLDLPAHAPAWNVVRFDPTSESAATALDELGFFENSDGLLRPRHPFDRVSMHFFFMRLVPAATLAACGLLVAIIWLLPGATAARVAPVTAAVIALAVSILEIGVTMSPYWDLDVRAYYARELSSADPGANLLGGLQEGARLVQGLGATLTDGFVDWHRMPGYGLLCATAALIGRTTDLIELASVVVVLQCVLFALAVGWFVTSAADLVAPRVAFLIGTIVVLMPKQLAYTQVDSNILAIQLMVLAALIRYLVAERDRQPLLRRFWEVNLAFALWFVMRTDVLPGWFVIAAVFAGRAWWRLAVPIVLMLAIAVPWALYKRRYTHEFALMPTNTGEVLMLSLCEVPGAFPYACVDDGYFTWAGRQGHVNPTSSSASGHAVREVMRQWATYPVHFAFMVLTKAHRAAAREAYQGFQTHFTVLFSGLHPAAGATRVFYLLIAVLAAALAARFEVRRTLLLGWAVFLNMPLFFVVFASSGRFYSAAGLSLLVATVPLLADRRFYGAVAQHPGRVAAAVACVVAFAVGAGPLERFVLARDDIHYWSPLLAPAKSTLQFGAPR